MYPQDEAKALSCLWANASQCEDCALYEAGLTLKFLLPRTLTGKDLCPKWLDGTAAHEFEEDNAAMRRFKGAFKESQ